ncbi:hypothetical protein ACQEU5_01535 [Marinactinospora thermotolerans]|uniref:SIS domain-containing protein n=1 Tax=Marinactinospora thermotolerans DSM 45154 TaxID=1122192 RepID=A0A1T4MAI0_9ACTN|nr:hypothetical protein [Marinactinospora thermotolerans]SJZ63856.1 hypothetical protein SAMN02745673_01019 [Marinactinospora thermotolerans DSM 45154]
MGGVEAHHVAALRELLAATPWLDRTEELARALRHTREPGGLLLVGTAEDEPWHLTAHLADESRYAGLPQLSPTLVRWDPPPDAPAHLRIGLDRLAEARRGETLFVVNPAPAAPVPLLERVDDARRTGATILALDQGDPELSALAHDAISLDPSNAPLSFDGLQHLVSTAAGHPAERRRRPGLRDRISRFLDVVSGPRVLD